MYIHYILCNKEQKATNKQKLEPAKLSIIIYGLVILGAIAVSIVIQRPIIYARYLLVITGLLIFTYAYIMAKIGSKKEI